MAEPVIAKPRIATVKPIPGNSVSNSPSVSRSENNTTTPTPLTTTTAVASGSASVSSVVQHIHRLEPPASVIPSRWRSGSGHTKERLRTTTATTEQQQQLNSDSGLRTDELNHEGRYRTTVMQHTSINKESSCTRSHDSYTSVHKPVIPHLSAAKSSGREASRSPGAPTLTGGISSASQRQWFTNFHRISHGSKELGGETLTDAQKSVRSTCRSSARRRNPSAKVDKIMEGNNNHSFSSTTPNNNSTNENSNNNITNTTSTATNITTRHSPVLSLRLTDLERPKNKGGYLSTRSKSTSAKRSRVQQKVVNLFLCKYSLLRTIAEEHGFKIQETEEDLEKNQFNLVWSDTVLPLTRLVRLANWQRTNHFPSMHLLCRKGHLGTTLGRMRKLLPTHYLFYPRTWSLRSERAQFMRFITALRAKKMSKFFIMKPNSGCQGRGIVVTRDPLNAVDDLDNYIIQEYIRKPLLLEGRKFDLRVYVLLTSIRAPSIFLFNDGLVRLCAEIYEKPTDSNVRNACKHLTNYAVNKQSPEYVFNDDAENGGIGNKRNFKFFNEWLESSGQDPDEFWERVAHVICKTILVAQPQIANVYNSCFPRNNDGYNCFEILGFDILIDSKMKPWLMEVNHTPSLATDTPLDYNIKHALVTEVWNILDIKTTDRKRDEKKVRDEFVQRIMRHPASASIVPGGKTLNPNEMTMSSSSPSTSSLLQQQNQNLSQSQLNSSAVQEQAAEWNKFVEERRAREDSKLHNFRRIFPSTNAEHQLVYEAVLARARAQCASPRPSWVNSPAPLSPQATEERGRRMDNNNNNNNNNTNNNNNNSNNTNNNNIGHIPSQRVTGAPNTGTTTTASERSAQGTPVDTGVDPSPRNASGTLSRALQMQKICEDMKNGRRSTKPTPRVSPVVPSRSASAATSREKLSGGTLLNWNSAQTSSKPTTMSGEILTLTQKRQEEDQQQQQQQQEGNQEMEMGMEQQKYSVNNHLSVVVDTEEVPRKMHVIKATLMRSGPSKTTTDRSTVTTITTTTNNSTMDRLEAIRNLQQQLDLEAECEQSPSQDSREDESFALDEE
ncbi:putative tubulin-tyrsoine ligase-like protein [Trypanosoma theileri]|uniref:Putative tubulin-tyrsoine ligase-like protein n=1 Tax=Trypanosoma theileri TaxID=67003 RepID=A0A1X0NV49_9TRYP|nr:putative tubulin-tyrsoine ligase-like protein [Trypanosoma theileri]ORC88576.1 putative tubulin-tyrsoine ligase-like protein [Trypanosoma theileri]